MDNNIVNRIQCATLACLIMQQRSVYRLLLTALFFILAFSTPLVNADSLNVLINGKAIHLEELKNPKEKYNESNWGGGIQYDFTPTENNWTPFASVGGFLDSFEEASYYAGGGAYKRFHPVSAVPGLNVDAGFVAFLMSRKDRNDRQPFPGVLPMLSVGTDRVAVNMTYVPKVHPKGSDLFFFQLRIKLKQFD